MVFLFCKTFTKRLRESSETTSNIICHIFHKRYGLGTYFHQAYLLPTHIKEIRKSHFNVVGRNPLPLRSYMLWNFWSWGLDEDDVQYSSIEPESF